MNIGENLKEIRIKKGISRQELAKKLNVSESTISRYENNKREPNRETLKKISDILECDLYELMGLSGLFDKIDKELIKLDRLEILDDLENKSKQIRSKYAESEEFCLFDIDRMFYSTILEIMSSAYRSDTLNYNLSNFSEEEIDEISNFVFNSYKLKVNEILERHRKAKK